MQTKQAPARIQELEGLISKASGVDLEAIRGRSRAQDIVNARHAVWYIANCYMGYSASKLGRIYERDHTTILSAVTKLTYTKYGELVAEGIRKANPELLQKSGNPVENWQFPVE